MSDAICDWSTVTKAPTAYTTVETELDTTVKGKQRIKFVVIVITTKICKFIYMFSKFASLFCIHDKAPNVLNTSIRAKLHRSRILRTENRAYGLKGLKKVLTFFSSGLLGLFLDEKNRLPITLKRLTNWGSSFKRWCRCEDLFVLETMYHTERKYSRCYNAGDADL